MGPSRSRQHPRKLKKLTFDTGALIAFDRGSETVRGLVAELRSRGGKIVVPACAIAEAWRDGSRQARLARLLKDDVTVVESLDGPRARAVGELCGRRETDDIVDAFVVLVALQHGRTVATSDPGDLVRLHPGLAIVPVR